MIAMIEELLELAASEGVNEILIGMAHRGRLAVLANVIGKGVAQIFSEFEGHINSEVAEGTGPRTSNPANVHLAGGRA